MATPRSVVRWLLVGRRDGVRASLRRRLGLFTWLDRVRPAARPDPSPAAAPSPAPTPSPEEGAWVDLGPVSGFAPGEVAEVLAGERPVAVACTADGVHHALDGVCPHAGGPLGDGLLEGDRVVCPWHGWSYDLGSGASNVNPETGVAVFPVRVREGRLEARLDAPRAAAAP